MREKKLAVIQRPIAGAARPSLRALLCSLIAGALIALPAWSASVVDVRIGNHPAFTRVVFELDQSAGYRLDRRTEGSVLLVRLDAAASPESLRWKSATVTGVEVEPATGGAIARISLRKPGLHVQEMILASPPRIVLDVMRADAPASARVSAPATREPAAPPVPVEAPPARPEEPPETASVPELLVEPEPRVEAPVEPEPGEVPEPVAGEREVIAVTPTPTDVRPPEPVPEPLEPTPARPPRRLRGETEPQESASPLRNPLVLGAIGALAFVLVGIALMRRRRRAEPEDFDETEFDASSSARIPEGGFPMDDRVAEPESDLYSGVVGRGGAERPSVSPSSIFDEDMDDALTRKEDGTMSQDMIDLPSDRAAAPPPPVASSGGDVARLAQDLERRMGQLEQQLGEANEAREKLERQVAAQTEELRVQRAAIARTQRALRSMTRGGDEKATEPAVRDDTQARTRVNL